MDIDSKQCAEIIDALRQPGVFCTAPGTAPGDTPYLFAHRAAILHVAAELALPPETVAQAYCSALSGLCGLASVPDFLPILTTKRVRAQLRATLARPSAWSDIPAIRPAASSS